MIGLEGDTVVERVPVRQQEIDVTIAVQIGRREMARAKGWVRRNEVETFVAVDSTPMPRGTDLTLDGRPGTWSRDSQVHFDQGLIADFAAAAGRAGTELQYAVYTAAASDAAIVSPAQ